MSNQSKQAKRPTREHPPQHQRSQPGRREAMTPKPIVICDDYRGSDKLKDRVALITGGDSGIGRAVAVHFAREGADVAIVYLQEDEDAHSACEAVKAEGRRCLPLRGDVGKYTFCQRAIAKTVRQLGKLDILVNNAAEQHPRKSIEEIDEKQLLRTFRTNIFAMFFLTQAALPHLKKSDQSSIINTSSITAYRGSAQLIDYAATKGAIVAFTRSLSQSLAGENIRANGVAPGPIWTPLIPATFPEDTVASFGTDVPMGRAGEPAEVAPAYVYLASRDAAYVTGQMLHVNGGEIVNG